MDTSAPSIPPRGVNDSRLASALSALYRRMNKFVPSIRCDNGRRLVADAAITILRAARDVHDGQSTWSQHTEAALALTRMTSTSSDIPHLESIQDQSALIGAVQSIAYHDPDAGPLVEVAEWCSRQWLRLLSQDPTNVGVLYGIGRHWFLKAQGALARDHAVEKSSSSSGEDSLVSPLSSPISNRAASPQQDDDEIMARLNSPEYIDARTSLQPAVDYLERAVTEATRQDQLSWELLCTAAEAYISIGNVTRPRPSRQVFSRAIEILRIARDKGFALSQPLQQYLDEYGRFVGVEGSP